VAGAARAAQDSYIRAPKTPRQTGVRRSARRVPGNDLGSVAHGPQLFETKGKSTAVSCRGRGRGSRRAAGGFCRRFLREKGSEIHTYGPIYDALTD